MSKPAPKPKLAAKPKSIKVFTATWGYQAQVIFLIIQKTFKNVLIIKSNKKFLKADDELTFDEGDILYVSNMDGDWWKGENLFFLHFRFKYF